MKENIIIVGRNQYDLKIIEIIENYGFVYKRRGVN